MKKAVLYGAGIQGEKFYIRWRKRYEIQYVIDKNAHRFFHGLPVYSFEEKCDDLKHQYIIIATAKTHYDVISRNLKEIGCIEFDDFIWMEEIDRKLMILYGNCHMAVIERYLNANPNVTKEFAIRRYYVSDADERYRIPEERQLKECSVFITQDIREENKAYVPGYVKLKEKLMRECTSIVIPNVFECNMFFPQIYRPKDKISRVNELHKKELLLNEEGSSVAAMDYILAELQGRRDINIDRLYESGYGIDDIINYILDKSTYQKEAVVDNFRKEMNKLKKRELNCNIKISDFIENNYQDKQLFYEPGHPTNILLCEYGRRILKYLKIELDETLPIAEGMDSEEVFIYESVKEALNLKFEQKYIKRNSINYTLQNRSMDLREYVVNYIMWNYGGAVEL